MISCYEVWTQGNKYRIFYFCKTNLESPAYVTVSHGHFFRDTFTAFAQKHSRVGAARACSVGDLDYGREYHDVSRSGVRLKLDSFRKSADKAGFTKWGDFKV